jgi:lipoate-protein ligase A
LRRIDAAHRFVLESIGQALSALVAEAAGGEPDSRGAWPPRASVGAVRRRGVSDLCVGDRKVSGNSLRVKLDHLLYHGTLLFDFPAALLDALLFLPPRQPEYRRGRRHSDFVANLPVAPAAIRQALVNVFAAHEELDDWPRADVDRLAADQCARRAIVECERSAGGRSMRATSGS